jgi:outer membrane protein OmpA-like peptidoglycan-associated protein
MMRFYRLGALAATLAVALVSLPAPAAAGLGDKLKKKAQDKAEQKAVDKIGKTAGDAKGGAENPATGAEPGASPGGSAAAPDEKVSAVSTKFDYVPGDKVVFFDDFTRDELGEFPAGWKLTQGTLEVAEMSDRRWLRSTSVESRFGMKLPAMSALPEFWTLELDFYCGQPSGNVLNVSAVKGVQKVWTVTFPYSGQSAYFESGKVTSNTPLESDRVWGEVHHVMIMARGTALKVYVDHQRVANAPEINPEHGSPDNFEIWLWSDKEPMIGNVRFAEGNKPTKDPFADGKLITYGIYFDSGSDVVKPESAPVLRQIAAYMEANAAVHVQILGHTDNQGTPDGNLDLSKRRSAAVAHVLSDQFKIAADRFQTDGMGDTQPISDNEKAEGRAMNRRVEFSKI